MAQVLNFDDIDKAMQDDKDTQENIAAFSAVAAAQDVNADQQAEALKVSEVTQSRSESQALGE